PERAETGHSPGHRGRQGWRTDRGMGPLPDLGPMRPRSNACPFHGRWATLWTPPRAEVRHHMARTRGVVRLGAVGATAGLILALSATPSPATGLIRHPVAQVTQ